MTASKIPGWNALTSSDSLTFKSIPFYPSAYSSGYVPSFISSSKLRPFVIGIILSFLSVPADFSSLMQAVRKNQKKRMRLKVSPWWLTAACLLGWTIGYGFPGGSNTQSDQIAVVTTVIDTVVVIHERVDTVYREVHLKSLVATSNAAKSKSASPKKHARQSEAISERSESDFISSALLQQAMTLPDPDSECYAANGMTVAESNYPFHMLATIPCK